MNSRGQIKKPKTKKTTKKTTKKKSLLDNEQQTTD